mmetsp:Transcript_23217/g.41872  ORF Transcript_23217/g.41872 Transcript_23217/m.41872 type:complete len:99 (+) Transcript_23217:35-331(+)
MPGTWWSMPRISNRETVPHFLCYDITFSRAGVIVCLSCSLRHEGAADGAGSQALTHPFLKPVSLPHYRPCTKTMTVALSALLDEGCLLLSLSTCSLHR